MNTKLPILSVAIGLAVAVFVASTYSSQRTETKEVAESVASSTESLPVAEMNSQLSGQELVASAANDLLVIPTLEAKTRQTVHLFGQNLVGTGTYCQMLYNRKLYLRLDLRLRVADEDRSLSQISDGNSLWEIHGQGKDKTLSHVNLGRLREVAANTQPLVPYSYWMALGGIPHLLANLNENFAFQSPKELTIGGHPVWSVEGTWKPEVLAKMLPDQSDAILAGKKPQLQGLPEQVPHGVTLILGRDKIIPKFPYGFSFHRDELVDEETGQMERKMLVTWELFKVQLRPELKPSHFDYRASQQTVQERTDQYVARLRAAAERMQH